MAKGKKETRWLDLGKFGGHKFRLGADSQNWIVEVDGKTHDQTYFLTLENALAELYRAGFKRRFLDGGVETIYDLARLIEQAAAWVREIAAKDIKLEGEK